MEQEYKVTIADIHTRVGHPYDAFDRNLVHAGYLLSDKTELLSLEGNDWRMRSWDAAPQEHANRVVITSEVAAKKETAAKSGTIVDTEVTVIEMGPGTKAALTRDPRSEDVLEGFYRVANESNNYTLVGSRLGKLVNSALQMGDAEELSLGARERMSQIYLGALVVSMFINPAGLSKQELYEIKLAAMEALPSFRTRLRDLSYDAQSRLGGPLLTSGANDAVSDIYTNYITHELAVLESKIREGSFAKHLGNEWFGNPRPWVEIVAASLLGSIAGLSLSAQVVPIATLAGSHTVKSYWDSRRTKNSLKLEPMMFLHQLNDSRPKD